eukprot:scaffold48_cov161-Amphora_coffeaeformis.AAC.12
MKHTLLLLAILVSRIDAFWMMMKNKNDGSGQMMAASSSSSAAAATEREPVDCIKPSALEDALKKATDAEAALKVAREAEEKALKDAQESEKALKAALKVEEIAIKKVEDIERALTSSLESEEKMQQALKASQNEISRLRKGDKFSNPAERIEKYHKDILSELAEINSNSEKQFDVLKQQIDSEMQRHKEKLKLNQATVERIDELEKEKAGFLGELKAFHQLYDRLEKKYEAKLQQEEEEKMAYFGESLDQEVAKIVGERELEWEQSIAETKLKAEEDLINLRAELEEKAEHEAEAMRKAHEKEVANLEQRIEDVKAALAEAKEKKDQEIEILNGACAKEIEGVEEDAIKRLADLQRKFKMDAAKEAAAVKEFHDAEVAGLQEEIKNAQDETKRALEQSEQIDNALKLKNEERQQQEQKYKDIIEGLEKELHEVHEEKAYWMKAFAKRAYFNSTQFVGDIIMFAEEAKVLTVDKAQEVKQRTLEFVNNRTGRLTKTLDPYTRPVGKFYRDYLSRYVRAARAAVRPVYDQHLAPVIADAHLFRRQKTAEFQKAVDDAFDELVSLANKRCKLSRKEIDSAPKMIRDRMRKVCKDPAVVIRDALRFFVVLLIIIFRKAIWNVIWGTVGWNARLIWYFISFGFLRKKKSPAGQDDLDANAEHLKIEQAAQ